MGAPVRPDRLQADRKEGDRRQGGGRTVHYLPSSSFLAVWTGPRRARCHETGDRWGARVR